MSVPLYDKILGEVSKIVAAGLDAPGTRRILNLVGGPDYSPEMLEGVRLWNEYLNKSDEIPYTPEQRYLHFLWDAFDKLPICVSIPLAVPFRRILAGKLFAHCGKNFICEEGCRFNYGHQLRVGDNVMFNRGCFFDTKGGISFGDFSCATENVKIFTHNHGESDHMERTYAPVVISDFAKLYTGCTILPGVTVGRQALVGAESLVTKDVPENMLVAGVPAKPVRPRNTQGLDGEQLNHYWLKNRLFQ